VRILLDECLPRPLRHSLATHEVSTVQEMGWSGIENGALLRRAVAEGFAVFLTVDRSIEYQQNTQDIGLAIIALRARSNDIVDLLPLMPDVLGFWGVR
jgi:hypothetical protein